jgi:hypothetical protein
MMTPKEKAKELLWWFRFAEKNNKVITPKDAALEFVKNRMLIYKNSIIELHYWQEVKQEIEKL